MEHILFVTAGSGDGQKVGFTNDDFCDYCSQNYDTRGTCYGHSIPWNEWQEYYKTGLDGIYIKGSQGDVLAAHYWRNLERFTQEDNNSLFVPLWKYQQDCVFVLVNGTIAGVGMLASQSPTSTEKPTIAIWITPMYRRNGYGYQLMEKLSGQCKEQYGGVPTVTLPKEKNALSLVLKGMDDGLLLIG